MIIAGIVTFNPRLERFSECLRATWQQVDSAFVFDNASNNIDQIEQTISVFGENVILYKNNINGERGRQSY